MAPACDMKLSQNTPDARFSPSLFQTLLNFKQNKRTGEGGRREEGEWEEREKWARGARGMCNNITISFIHSFCPSASSQEHSPLILALCPFTGVKGFLLSLSSLSLLWVGLVEASSKDLESDYFMDCPSLVLKNNWLCWLAVFMDKL